LSDEHQNDLKPWNSSPIGFNVEPHESCHQVLQPAAESNKKGTQCNGLNVEPQKEHEYCNQVLKPAAESNKKGIMDSLVHSLSILTLKYLQAQFRWRTTVFTVDNETIKKWCEIGKEEQKHILLTCSRDISRSSNKPELIKFVAYGLKSCHLKFKQSDLPHRLKLSTLWAEFAIKHDYQETFKQFQETCFKAIFQIFAMFILCGLDDEVMEYLREIAKRDHFVDINLHSSCVRILNHCKDYSNS
jgi:hypothetical protein